MVKWLLNC